MVKDRVQELLDTDAGLRKMRWVGAAFAILQFVLYNPDPPTVVPFPQLQMGIAVAGLIVVVNVVSLLARRSRDPVVLTRLGVGQLVADTVIVYGVTWLFSFDPESALWALLVIPVIEGAVRFQLRGALATWAAIAILYPLRMLWTATTYEGIAFEVETLTYRMGIVLLVGAACGYLAQNLRVQMIAHRGAHDESRHRAEMLTTVATAGRAMSVLDAEHVLQTSVDCLLDVGFDASLVCFVDEDGTYSVAHTSGLEPGTIPESNQADRGIVGRVLRTGRTIAIPDYPNEPDASPAARSSGFRSVTATPIRGGGRILAVLVGGKREPGEPALHEMECLELLAAQAGAALENAQLFRERQRFEAELAHQAFHDGLTQLPNRALFHDRLQHALDLQERTRHSLAVLFCDLDRFKKVNDSFGHEVGDGILRSVAERFQASVRPSDTVSRFGGDEFTVLLEGLADPQDALTVARRILVSMQLPFTVQGRDVFLSASIGIALTTGHRDSSRDFLHEADLAMYRAKQGGGGGYDVFRPAMVEQARRSLEVEEELHRALETDELVLHYQPIYPTEGRRPYAFEALVRWQHPKRGLLAPGEFLDVAEQTSLIMPLGTWVLGAACRQMHRWTLDHGARAPEALSVNLSATEFRQPGFVKRLRSLLDETGLDPALLVLEVTEDVVMGAGDEMDRLVSKVRATGVRLAIDDFGRGYSSLSYLKRFPVDFLKIDRSFVDGLARNPEDRAIVRSVLMLAQDLGIRVIAEGVETPEQHDYLQRIGCDFVQGFHLGRPQSANAASGLFGAPRLVS